MNITRLVRLCLMAFALVATPSMGTTIGSAYNVIPLPNHIVNSTGTYMLPSSATYYIKGKTAPLLSEYLQTSPLHLQAATRAAKAHILITIGSK